ncbi:hypothetical protein HMPREF1624_01135 [Sporothrix schenckii ATCC 58251]|uniref:L-ornithine N(5)-oxygenase n=1 Tax=Sporothrix schenckii (strain ATCC 58251 / de Perez 2211183) TaxID=1391915 RepID=U7Q6K3_SPOS1|nr:hypothetical protein HMPREF1624_01135 [Sporothrix schenckii ATCC 58251]
MPRDALFVADDEPLNPHPPIKVVIVGAGLGGIITAILLSHKVPNLKYTLFDRQDRIGGTWAANIYPGVRCDIPSHCYQTTFAPNPNWAEYYSTGSEIRAYYEKLVDDYGLRSQIRLRHELLSATWRPDGAVWDLAIKDLNTEETFHETTPFFINAQGRLSRPKLPDVPGLVDTFAGTLVHTATWDPNIDLTGKRVAVIGNGSSGQQILPHVAPRAAHVDHYVRSRVWITPTFQKNLVEATGDDPGAHRYTDAEKAAFAADPAAYLAYRRTIEGNLHTKFQRNILGSPENEALRASCIKTMRQRVGGSQEWLDRLVPDFAPGCKRLTPAPGYLETIVKGAEDGTVAYVDTPLVAATQTALVTADGVERPVDVIIAATGFANGFVPHFPVVGRNGVDLRHDWSAEGATGYPETYFGVMAPGMPNYFMVLQAQANGGGGSIPLQVELSATYIAKVLRKMQLQQYRSITPGREATEDFNAYCQGHFRDKVASDSCSSWLKAPGDGRAGGRTLVWWPGSGHHRMQACLDPRWEDFEFEQNRTPQAQRNRYHYFGNGWTTIERDAASTEALTGYLHEVGAADLRSLHERWYE